MNAPVLKTGKGESPSRVRIPPPPPYSPVKCYLLLALMPNNPMFSGDDKGQKLKFAYEAGCKVFSNSLGPEYNALHKNHFHFDMGIGAGCTINDFINEIWRSFRKLNY